MLKSRGDTSRWSLDGTEPDLSSLSELSDLSVWSKKSQRQQRQQRRNLHNADARRQTPALAHPTSTSISLDAQGPGTAGAMEGSPAGQTQAGGEGGTRGGAEHP